jgi:eukaryotic-like serine/threonine-protein kinase
MALAADARLNHYEILSPLGKGGMGEVYLAEDTRLRRKVALKLLPEEFTRNAERVRRFEQEARTASALNHPNILTIHEIGEANGAHYMVTEFIDGQTLRERLKGEKLALSVALDVAIQAASALVAAHNAGIIHRDIKPGNVMLRRDGYVKVLDFGLAKLTEQLPDEVDSETMTTAKVNTDPGTLLGTVGYMSPEQARGLTVNACTDIFSLGVVLYELRHALRGAVRSGGQSLASSRRRGQPRQTDHLRG